jgi:anti-sigma factor RsiW
LVQPLDPSLSQYAALEGLHDEISAAALAYTPGIAMERKLAAHFLAEKKSPFRLWSWSWLSASVMSAAAIAVVMLIVSLPTLRTNSETDAIGVEILDNHLRALQVVHQVDVPSSDQRTVKPWFQGKTDF